MLGIDSIVRIISNANPLSADNLFLIFEIIRNGLKVATLYPKNIGLQIISDLAKAVKARFF